MGICVLSEESEEPMDKPIIADNKPIKLELDQEQEYYFCRCGRSVRQPFCDGSHAGTDFKPLRFTPQASGDAYLCRCKHSANLPYCDGSHKQFSSAQAGQDGPDVGSQGYVTPG